MVDDRAGETGTGRAGKSDTGQALAMLSAFASVGARTFDVTLTSEGQIVPGGYRSKRSLEQMRGTIARVLQDAARKRHNVIIRPRSTTATLIQLDDLDSAKAQGITPHAFIVFQTSPGNYQAWVAVKDSAPDFPLRLKRGTGADPTASGSTRISGSLNFKSKYAPAFPLVEITHTNAGKVTTAAELEKAGLVAAREEPEPPPSVPRQIPTPKPAPERRWPDYQQAIAGQGRRFLKPDNTPDRSLADFFWCKWAIERGWSIEATAAKLAEVSEKAQERVRLKDKGYPLLTARNAARAIEKERGRR